MSKIYYYSQLIPCGIQVVKGLSAGLSSLYRMSLFVFIREIRGQKFFQRLENPTALW